MYGQMTAGSWIYIGTQGILQGTFETFAAVARKRFDGSLRGPRRADGRLRRHGRRAAARRHDARRRLPRRRRRRAPSRAPRRDALPRPRRARPRRRAARGRGGARGRRRALDRHRRLRPARSSARCSSAASCPTSSPTRRAPTIRSAATCPTGSRSTTRRSCARATRQRYIELLARLDGRATAPRWSSSRSAARTSSTTATACAPRLARAASTEAFAYPGFVPAYVRPLFCTGTGPFRWAALSGDPGRHRRHRRGRAASCFPRTSTCSAGSSWRAGADRVPGTAGAHLLARLRRAPPRWACASTSWCARARCSAPIVIGRDHLDSGSVASPYRETEGDDGRLRRDRRLAAPERAARTSRRARRWVSLHHGGGVGIGYSIHAGMVGRRRRHRRGRAARSSGC